MHGRALLVGLALAAALAQGCSPSGCPAGRAIACACADGRTGAQTCRADGTYDVCTCSGDDGGTPPDGETMHDLGPDAPPPDLGPDAPVDLGTDAPDLGPWCTIDLDHDGHLSLLCGGDDCDDTNADRFPGHPEVCDGVDQDCSGVADDGAASAACASAVPNAIGACIGGRCDVASCVAPYLDCDAPSTTVDGCEADSTTSHAHCGRCDVACGFACAAGACDDVIDVAAFGATSCALQASGLVDCWGDNSGGGIGDGTTTDRHVPTRTMLTDVVRLARGGMPCAIRSDGHVWCWGSGPLGMSGSVFSTSTVPVEIPGITDAVGVGTGFAACVVHATGTVSCWGSNAWGSVGDGTTTDRSTPVDVVGITDAIQVVSGGGFACALHVGGSISCWGDNVFGELGAAGPSSSLPVYMPLVTDARMLAAGPNNVVAVRTGGETVMWGRIAPLGTVSSPFPTVVDGIAVSAGTDLACALGLSGEVTCAGGGLSTSPITEPGLVDAVGVASAYQHSCARRANGGVMCWGTNTHGEVGNGTTSPLPVLAPVDVFP